MQLRERVQIVKKDDSGNVDTFIEFLPGKRRNSRWRVDFPVSGQVICEALRKNNPDDNAILLSPSVISRTNGALRHRP